LSRSYLTPIDPDPSSTFWQILERAQERRTGDDLAFSGEEGVEICSDWLETKGTILQVLVRKPTSGTKGMTRSLGALSITPAGLRSVPLSELVDVNPLSRPAGEGRGIQGEIGMEVPFNLSLTDEQRRRRGEVPLPYAHEGEGAGPVGRELDWGDEEDEDDEEI